MAQKPRKLPESVTLVKPDEPDYSIVPFHGSKRHDLQPCEVLRVLEDMSKKTSTAIIYCDFARFNYLQVCTTRDLNCVENSRQFVDKYCPVVEKCLFTDIATRDQCIVCYNNIVGDQCMCPTVVARDHSMISADLNVKLVHPCCEPVENDNDDVFEDCIDWASHIFSMKTPADNLYSKYCTTKKTLKDLLKSLLLLHLFVGESIQSWKDTAMLNIAQLTTPVQNKATLHHDLTKAPVAEKTRGYSNSEQATGKQLRRLNRITARNNVVNSNRQRGMKNGCFQKNVGHRESWHR